jgi:hypothetical protein
VEWRGEYLLTVQEALGSISSSKRKGRGKKETVKAIENKTKY